LWRRINKKIGRWLQGQLLLGFIVGLMTYLGLKIFSMPFTLTLAVIAGVFELIPFVGPIISAIPAVILGFAQSTSLGLFMILLYFVIQQLENHLIVPIVTNKLVGLNPVIVILALIAGGNLAGLVGVLVAIPLTVTITEIFNDFATRKQTPKSLPRFPFLFLDFGYVQFQQNFNNFYQSPWHRDAVGDFLLVRFPSARTDDEISA